ncbi:hypothetical protein Dsin_030447 [Dipteronia sinensis]|uniref:BAH domain-containing protein n=1 Tax=Dipteronia sinensis TaxID=43782 RepID=A0AAD9ZJG0_9ROSI|nr:hypothetical protein Dsin_030447 [Dipteronia sinensis]
MNSTCPGGGKLLISFSSIFSANSAASGVEIQSSTSPHADMIALHSVYQFSDEMRVDKRINTDNNNKNWSTEYGWIGIQIFLSAIKEWMVEFGSSMISTSFRPDMAWYWLGKPSKQYAPWYEPVLKINHPAYISSNPSTVERHEVVHGQIIVKQFSEFPDKTIKKCTFVTGLCVKMGERNHIKWLVKKKVALKMVHGRLMQRGSQTVLANTANEREVFLTFHCLEFELGDVKEIVVVQIRSIPWGHQHRKANAYKDKAVREEAEDRKIKGLSTMYFCKSLYWPERERKLRGRKKLLKCRNGFTSKGTEYRVHDFVYLSPDHFAAKDRDQETLRGGRDVGLKAYAIRQLLEIEVPKEQGSTNSTKVKVHRFFRSADISAEKAYYSDIREVYYGEPVWTVPIFGIEGKCDIRKKDHFYPDSHVIIDHIFFCEHLYDPDKVAIKTIASSLLTLINLDDQFPANIKLNLLKKGWSMIPIKERKRKKHLLLKIKGMLLLKKRLPPGLDSWTGRVFNWLPISLACHRSPVLLFLQQPGQFLLHLFFSSTSDDPDRLSCPPSKNFGSVFITLPDAVASAITSLASFLFFLLKQQAQVNPQRPDRFT